MAPKAKRYVDDYKEAVEFQGPLASNWKDWYKLYRGKTDTDKDGRSNIHVPYPFSTVESELPILVANGPRWEATANNPWSIKAAKAMDKLLSYQYEQMGMFPKLVDLVKGSLIYGTGIAKVYWRWDGTIEKDEKGADVVTALHYDAPVFEDVDIFDFLIDPNATSIEGARYVIHRKWVTKEYIKEEYGRSVENESTTENESKRDRLQVMGMNPPTEGEVELVEHWTRTEVTTLVNDKIVRGPKPNRFGRIPFFDYCPTPVKNEFYGITEFEQCKSLYWELNDLRNQRMDYNNILLSPPLLVDREAGILPESAEFRVGAIIFHDHTDGLPINVLNMPGTPMASFQEEQLIKQDIQTTTAVSEYTRGNSTKNQNTATGVMREVEGSFARFDLKLKLLEDFLARVGGFLKDLNLMFMDRNEIMRIMGPDGEAFLMIRPGEIKGDYDISVVKGSTLPQSKSVKQQQAMNAFNMFAKDGYLNPIGAIELRKKVLETMGWEDTDKWFSAPAPPPGTEQPPGGPGLVPHENQPQPTSEEDMLRMAGNPGGGSL